jgi:hypothetical protein
MGIELITPEFMFMMFIVGVLLGLITIATCSPMLKVVIDLAGLIVIMLGLMVFIPSPNFQTTTTEQFVTSFTSLINYFIGVVVPFIIGDSLSSAGYRLVTGQKSDW